MSDHLCTAVIPAAGLGSRMLPATKSVAKELLPVIDTPVVEIVANEASKAGHQRLTFVTSPNKESVVTHFIADKELESKLSSKGRSVIDRVRKSSTMFDVVGSVTQRSPLGLGHAVLRCRDEVCETGRFSVLLPDDVLMDSGVLTEMVRIQERLGGTVLCAEKVSIEDISSYGVVDVGNSVYISGRGVAEVKGIVEKPASADAPSNLGVIGRYVFDSKIFAALEQTGPGSGGEIQLTDAIAKLIEDGESVHVLEYEGVRHDTGNPVGYIKAMVDYGLRSEAFGSDLSVWMADRLVRGDEGTDYVR